MRKEDPKWQGACYQHRHERTLNFWKPPFVKKQRGISEANPETADQLLLPTRHRAIRADGCEGEVIRLPSTNWVAATELLIYQNYETLILGPQP